eukprot:403367200
MNQNQVNLLKTKRELNKNLTNLQKFFISDHQTLHITDFRAMYKIYSNSENSLKIQSDQKQVNNINEYKNISVIVLDKRLGFSIEEYNKVLKSNDAGLKLGQAHYSILKDKFDLKILKVQYEKASIKNLAQTIAENSQDTKMLQKLYKSIITNLLGFLEQNQALNIKFNFNPEQIIVFNDDIIEDIKLQPQILFEMDSETLDRNECLKVRWNITIDKSQQDQIGSLSTCEASNKLSLSMLAYWLEDDGYVRGSLKDKYLKILTNTESMQEYLKSLQDVDCRFHKALIKNINKSYNEISKEIQSITIQGDKKISINRIMSQTEAKRSQIVFIDWLLDQYQKLEKTQQSQVKQKLRQILRSGPQEDGNKQILEELIEFIPELGNAKHTSASQTLVEKMQTKHIKEAFNKNNRKVLILQILSLFENHSKAVKLNSEI